MKQKNLLLAITPLLLTTLLMSTISATAQVRQVGLAEMVESSGMIFSGQVLSVEGVLDERGDIVTRTTFRVERPIRGVMPGEVTITQYGGVTEAGASMTLEHMRYFNEGERVLVLLYPPSDLGFTSPIGMDQGAFDLGDDNRVGGLEAHLFEGIEPLLGSLGIERDGSGALPLTSMISLIGALSGGTR